MNGKEAGEDVREQPARRQSRWELQLVNGIVAAVSDTTTQGGDGVLEGQRLFLISSFAPAKLADVLVSRMGVLDSLTRGVRSAQ